MLTVGDRLSRLLPFLLVICFLNAYRIINTIIELFTDLATIDGLSYEIFRAAIFTSLLSPTSPGAIFDIAHQTLASLLNRGHWCMHFGSPCPCFNGLMPIEKHEQLLATTELARVELEAHLHKEVCQKKSLNDALIVYQGKIRAIKTELHDLNERNKSLTSTLLRQSGPYKKDSQELVNCSTIKKHTESERSNTGEIGILTKRNGILQRRLDKALSIIKTMHTGEKPDSWSQFSLNKVRKLNRKLAEDVERAKAAETQAKEKLAHLKCEVSEIKEILVTLQNDNQVKRTELIDAKEKMKTMGSKDGLDVQTKATLKMHNLAMKTANNQLRDLESKTQGICKIMKVFLDAKAQHTETAITSENFEAKLKDIFDAFDVFENGVQNDRENVAVLVGRLAEAEAFVIKLVESSHQQATQFGVQLQAHDQFAIEEYMLKVTEHVKLLSVECKSKEVDYKNRETQVNKLKIELEYTRSTTVDSKDYKCVKDKAERMQSEITELKRDKQSSNEVQNRLQKQLSEQQAAAAKVQPYAGPSASFAQEFKDRIQPVIDANNKYANSFNQLMELLALRSGFASSIDKPARVMHKKMPIKSFPDIEGLVEVASQEKLERAQAELKAVVEWLQAQGWCKRYYGEAGCFADTPKASPELLKALDTAKDLVKKE